MADLDTTLLIVGNDKLGKRLIYELGSNHSVFIVVDASTNVNRIWKLIRRQTMPLVALIKMTLAEVIRKNYEIPELPKIYNNKELLKIISDLRIAKIYLFRCGLIINKQIQQSPNLNVLNVHCARLPDYGGVASIYRALKDNAYQQAASLHKVTDKIDEGEILDTEQYTLDSSLPYYKNEDIAYSAGIKILLKIFREDE
jgi:methionyl-tRNA formyltransferase